MLDGPSPLGLRLRKSRSLVDLIQCKLFQDKSAHEQFDGHNNVSDTPMKKEVRSGAPTAGERMKASNFPANVLRIGSWEVKNFQFPLFLRTREFPKQLFCSFPKQPTLTLIIFLSSTFLTTKVIWSQSATLQSISLFGRSYIMVSRVR